MNEHIILLLIVAMLSSGVALMGFRGSYLLRGNNRRPMRSIRASVDQNADEVATSPTIDLLYDSECPICQMEVNFLRKRDINNLIKFTDLSSPDYDPKDHGNVQFKEGMRKIRAVLPDNTVVTGVEVFRRTYEAIGLGWVFAATNLPIIGNIADFIYDAWAENRLRLTGRGDLADQLAETAEELRMAEPVDCEDSCDLDFGDDDDEPPLEFTTEVEKDLGA